MEAIHAAKRSGSRKGPISRAARQEERAAYLFRRCATRPPEKVELALLVKFYTTQKARFEKKELDANAVAGQGEGDVNDRAAWTTLARSLLNLDEFVSKR